MKWHCFGLILAVSFFASASSVSAVNFQVETWTTERGLPDSTVTAVAQTPDGYLWVGTYNGLARFDGFSFVTFDPENTPALAHARVRQLFLDRQGALWINTFDGSLTRLRDGRFAREWSAKSQDDRDNILISSTSNSIALVLERGDIFKKDLATAPGEGWTQLALPNRNILTAQTPSGQCLAWFNGQGERSWAKRMWRLEGNHFQPMPQVSALAGRRIRHIAPVAEDQFWLGTDAALYFWNGESFGEVTPTNGPAEMDFSFLCPAANGEVWAIADGRLGKISGRRWMLQVGELKDVFGQLVPRFGMSADGAGGVWLRGTGRGLFHVAGDGSVTKINSDANGLNDRITSLLLDGEGNGWAGFELAGLARIRESRFQPPPLGLDDASRSARSVCVDGSGQVWFGLMGGGLVGVSGDQVTNMTFSGDAPRGSVVSGCADGQGRLWVSAAGENLLCGSNGNFSAVLPPLHNVKVIFASRSSGKIWAGTRSGLFMSEDGGRPFQPVTEISSKTVRALAEDFAGNLWCGDDGGTLYRLKAETVEAFRPDENPRGHAIWAILPEPDGTLWIGTFRGGLLRFKAGKFFRYTQAQGLPDNVVGQILSDHEGHLWLGTHQGIFRVTLSSLEEVAAGRRTTVEGVTFGQSDGLPSLECSGGYNPAACRAADGTLWFTTLKGAVSIQPAAVRLNARPPAVLVEQVLAQGKPIWPVPADSADSRTHAVLQIPPGRGQMEFHFVGLSLSAPARVKYRYQLLGEDQEWVEAGGRRFAHYASLRPAKYRFRVTAGNADGVWNPAPAEIAFTVQPHFYQTWWFYTLMTTLMIGSAFAVARHRFKLKLRRETEQMERRHELERERTRIAKDIHDDLGGTLTLIAVMGDLAKQDLAPDRIAKISQTARHAVKSLDEIVWAVNPRNDSLAQLVDYVGQFALDYLRAAEVRCRLDVPEQLPDCELPSNVRHNVFLAVREALQNILKHARATEVWLRVKVAEESIEVQISDDGQGFVAPSPDAHADGVRNMRQRMFEIGGKCEIHSQSGAGTQVRLWFPRPQA